MTLPAIAGVIVTNPLDDVSLVIGWTAPTVPVLGYNVYRSLSREGAMEQVNTGLVLVTQYRDYTARQQSRADYWFTVTAVDGSGEGPQGLPVSQDPMARFDDRGHPGRKGDLVEMNQLAILAEGVRRNEIILGRGGEFVDVYVRRTAGSRCTNCYVPDSDQPAYKTCPVCFGTTFLGGYDKFPNVLMKVEDAVQNIVATDMGFKVSALHRSWVTTFPLMKAGDIVVRRLNNRRYEVQGPDAKMSRGIIVRQEFNLGELLPSDAPAIFLLT